MFDLIAGTLGRYDCWNCSADRVALDCALQNQLDKGGLISFFFVFFINNNNFRGNRFYSIKVIQERIKANTFCGNVNVCRLSRQHRE